MSQFAGAPLVLLVASGGGHLHELALLADRATPSGWRRSWLVPPGAQADDLVSSGEVHHLHDTHPRDLAAVAANTPLVYRLLRRLRPDAVVSTGAAVAVPTLGIASLLGVECHYVESGARVEGPSLTGRLLAPLPGVRCYAQWPGWEGAAWSVPGCVFDGFTAQRRNTSGNVRRVVVTFGTQTRYGFRRAVERLRSLLPAGVDVLWQVGATDVDNLSIDARPFLSPPELRVALRAADVVVAHAGVGAALGALAEGKCPVLLPRERSHGEHVDDHQSQIADAIGRLGLAVARRVEQLTLEDLQRAASVEVVGSPPAPLRLDGRLGQALAQVPPAW